VNEEAAPVEAPMTGLSHVQLAVSDLGASVGWYTRALGVEHYAGDIGAGYVALRHRGARVVIVLSEQAGDAGGEAGQSAGDGERLEGFEHLDHLAFAVPDGATLQRWADHLVAIGIDHPGVVLENGNPSLQLRDPDGIAIELVAPSSRGARDGTGQG
jgi:catechol-2,3-dioxygenase